MSDVFYKSSFFLNYLLLLYDGDQGDDWGDPPL